MVTADFFFRFFSATFLLAYFRLTMANKKSPKVAKFVCNCGKVYAHASSLSKHTRKCSEATIYYEEPTYIDTENDQNEYMGVINKLVNDNNELKQFMVEQTKELQNQNAEHKRETNEILTKVMEMSKPQTINNTIHGNINNNRVNINMFLNTQCSGALNFTDFIKQISVSEADLENNDGKLRDAIQEVSRKSMQTLVDWKEKNPDYDDLDSDFSNKCITIQKGSNAGTEREILYPKVIKTLAKESTLDKNFVEN